MKKIAAILLIFSLWQASLAQEKSIELPHISITGKKEESGYPLDSMLSRHPAQSATQVLSLNPAISLKNYGPGNSASLGIRGTGASHSNISWKGIMLSNPMLGMNDLSILPGQLLDGARLICGGQTVSGFSGNFGGIIQLDTRPKALGSTFRLGNSAGSFSDFQHWGLAEGNWGKSRFTIKTWHQSAQNNFTYHWDEKKKEQFHARQTQFGLLSEWSVPLGQKWAWKPAIWAQNGHRQLPPSAFENQADANQTDQIYRFVNDWQYTGNNTNWELGQAFSQQDLHYVSPQLGINSHNLSREHQLRAGFKRNMKIFFWEGQFLQKYTAVQSNNYNGIARQWQTDLLTSVTWHPGQSGFQIKMQGQTLAYRNTSIENRGIWFLPGLELGWTTSRFGQWRAGISRKTRLPGLNDLFWQNAGNPNLVPENGWTLDGNWLITKNITQNLRFQSNMSVFQSRINDYIQWLPVSGHWSPDNITVVDIKGIHFQENATYSLGNWRLEAFAGLQFSSSIQSKERFEGDEGLGKQMMYVPRWNRVYGAEIQWKKLILAFWLEHTGIRFTDPANEAYLPAYCLINSRISTVSFTLNQFSFEGFFEGRNLTQVSYQSVLGYPMPEQQFKVGLQITIHTNQ